MDLGSEGNQVGNDYWKSDQWKAALRRMREQDPPEQPGEQFISGPDDVEVTYSPSGKYPLGQYVPTTEEQRQMDREAKRGGNPSRLFEKFKMRKD